MKAILEFNLDDVDDRHSHKQCVKAKDMALALSEISDKFREINKYGCCSNGVKQFTAEMFYSILSEHEISIDDIVY